MVSLISWSFRPHISTNDASSLPVTSSPLSSGEKGNSHKSVTKTQELFLACEISPETNALRYAINAR